MKKIWLVLPVLCLLPLAGASAQVPGSYQESCKRISQNGRFLSALCRAPGGQWVRSTLDLGRCRGQGVANAYGRLSCGNVQGSAAPAGRGGGYDGGYDGDNGYGDDNYAPQRPRYAPPPQDDY